MKKLPRISIVTPSLNQGQFIERTILSVLNQDYPNIEYIVIDGGSTDNTLEAVKKYEDRLIWKSEPDNGQSDAINKGFRAATGDILAWLNSDDTYNFGTIKTVCSYLAKYPEVDVMYGDGKIVNEDDEVIGVFNSGSVDLRRWLYHGQINIFQPSTFFRRSVLSDIGLLDDNLHYNMDTDYWIRMALKKLNTQHVRKPLANLRWHQAAKTYNILPQHRKLHLKILRKYDRLPYVYYFIRHIFLVEVKKLIFGNKKIFKKQQNIEGQKIFTED